MMMMMMSSAFHFASCNAGNCYHSSSKILKKLFKSLSLFPALDFIFFNTRKTNRGHLIHLQSNLTVNISLISLIISRISYFVTLNNTPSIGVTIRHKCAKSRNAWKDVLRQVEIR